ncbi:hypothetical protein ACFQ77_30305 [Streptomyces virginiae]
MENPSDEGGEKKRRKIVKTALGWLFVQGLTVLVRWLFEKVL